MPLPDVATLQNSDTLQAEQNPAFMTDPITSPNTTVGVPIAPQAAPQPVNGTGDVNYGRGQDSPFSQDFLNKVYGPGPNTRTPGNLNTIDYNQAKEGTDRYPVFQPGSDNEETYGLNQGPFTQLKNGIVKGIAGAGGALLDGLTTIPDTISAIANGKADELYNTPTGRSVDTYLKNLENSLPNYVTHDQQNRNPLLNAIPFSGGSANFWGNTFIKNLGPMVGAIGSAVLQDAAVGIATDGIGDAALVPKQLAQASLWMNKILTGTEDAGQILNDATKLGRQGEQILDLQKIKIAAGAQKIADFGRYFTNLYTTARTMSASGAREQSDSMRQNLISQYVNKNGFQPIGDDLQKIEDTATAAGNSKFAIDTILMMAQERIGMDNILRPLGAAPGKYISEAQRALGTDLGNVGFKEGTTDLEYKGTAGLWNKIKPLAIPSATMGVIGGAFYGTGEAVKNYYQEKYDGKIRGTLSDMVKAVGDGMAAEFGTKEGYEQMFIGTTMGALFGLVGKGLEKLAGTELPSEAREKMMADVNAQTTSGFMSNNFESSAKTLSNAEKLRAANEAGDTFEYDNIKHNEFVNFATVHDKNGMPEVGREKLRQLKELNPEKFTEYWKMDDTPENRAIADQYTNRMLSDYDSIIKTRKSINSTFRNPFKPDEKDEEGNATGRYQIFENYKDTLTHLASIGRNVADRVENIRKSAADLYTPANMDTLSQLTSPFRLKNYNDELKGKAKDLEDTLKTDLTGDRKGDRAHLNYLNKLTGEVDKLLAGVKYAPSEGEANFHQVYNSMDDLKTFEKLVNYKTNGEKVLGGLGEGANEVPKEVLAELATMGGNLNKLNILKVQAAETYDRLSSKAGFEKWYNADKARYDAQTAPESQQQEPTTATVSGLGTGKTATEEPEIKVTNPYSKQESILKKGDDIYVNQKKGNPVKATIDSQNPDGSVNVKHADGTIQVLKPSDIFSKPDTQKPVATTVAQPAPVGTPPEAKEGIVKEDRKPDIATGIISTSSPRYETPDLPDDNYHRRVQNSLYDMGQSDPKVFNQENAPNLRIQIVTPNTQVELGFPKDWIKNTGGDDSTIRSVYIVQEGNQKWYMDSKGNKLGKVGETIDPKVAVYDNMRTAELKNSAGQNRYHDINEESKGIANWWESQRKAMLSKTKADQLPTYSFSVSRGIEKKNTGVKNSVIKVGLINEGDLYKSIIALPSVGETFINPTESLEATKTGINIPEGRTALNHGLNLTWLDNHHFEPQEAENLFNLLKFNSDLTKEDGDRSKARQFIKENIYTLQGDTKVSPKPHTISIKDDGLYLGQNPTVIPFNPLSLDDHKAEITEFLEKNAFHNIDKQQLNRIITKGFDPEALKYRELGVEDGKLVTTKEWPTYNHYLLSDEGGRSPILSTNIAIPQDGERPVVQKYSTLKNLDEYTPPPAAPKTEVKAEKTAEPAEEYVSQRPAPIKLKTGVVDGIYEYVPEVGDDGREIRVKKLVGYRIGGVNSELITPNNPEAVERNINKLIAKDNATKIVEGEGDLSFLSDPTVVAGPETKMSFGEVLPNDFKETEVDCPK